MAPSLNVMIALQTPDGLAFGYVFEASRTHVAFTVQSQIPPGTTMAWRMELKGYTETIMGRLTVTQAEPARGAGEWPRYQARVDEIPDEDLALLSVWMEDQEKGGTSRRMEKDPDRFVKDMFSEGMRSASAAQTKLVIERMNERRLKREQMFRKKKSGIGGDFGLSRESADVPSSAAQGSARGRISAALADFTRRPLAPATPGPEPALPVSSASPPASPDPLPWGAHGGQEGAVSQLSEHVIAAALDAVGLQSDPRERRAPTPAVPPPTPAAKETRAGDEPEDALIDDGPEDALIDDGPEDALIDDEPDDGLIDDGPQDELIDDGPEDGLIDDGPPAVAEPPVAVEREASPPRVRLRYDAAAYAEDYRRHLRTGGLFLAGMALGARGQAVAVEIRLPSGATLACDAQVVAALPSGTGLMLMLTRAERDLLAREVG